MAASFVAITSFSITLPFPRSLTLYLYDVPPHDTLQLRQHLLRAVDAVVDGEFARVRSADYRGRYMVILFAPAAFTFVCQTEGHALSRRKEEFDELNASVLMATTDTKHTLLAWTKMPPAEGGLGPMRIPLLGDVTKQMARDFGVLIEDGEDAGLALRGLFIVDDKGILRHASVNDLPVGRNVDEILRLVRAFQHADEHGVVCPINWTPGKRTMVADPEKSKEYFRAVYGPDGDVVEEEAEADGAPARKRARN